MLMTGRWPYQQGVIDNSIPLSANEATIGKAFKAAGYDTAYIGKWHLDGHGRSSYIPPERRQGFGHNEHCSWQVLECTHDYNHSIYYAGNDPSKRLWEGDSNEHCYDAEAQTRAAQEYIHQHDPEKPFLLVLSWGPPHNPYDTAPQRFRDLYDPEKITFRPNVILNRQDKPYRHYTLSPAEELAGYYAHISALDACLADLLQTLDKTGLAENTIFVYTSDHGDMLWSHGEWRKQWPFDESIRVPFLLRYPRQFGRSGKALDALINTPEIMPTLLGLCGLPIPGMVEGRDLAPILRGEASDDVDVALIACYQPFSEFQPAWGGRAYRGIRTRRYTFARDLNGPWLFFDNETDPYQQHNLCGDPDHVDLQSALDQQLQHILAERGDEFLPGETYMQRWGYLMDESGAVPFRE